MKITLIAYTELGYDFFTLAERMGYDLDDDSQYSEDLIEFAGRSCYESYRKPNEKTRANKDYLANVATQKHFSVFEHASATFFFQDVSRSLTHELVRHRHFSYSQVSQRYCDTGKRPFAEHPVLESLKDHHVYYDIQDHHENSQMLYEKIVQQLVEKGYSRKEARGAARQVMPEGTSTDIVVTGNFRAWIEFINKRNTSHADAEIHKLAAAVKEVLQGKFTNAFQEPVFEDETREQPVSLQSVAVPAPSGDLSISAEPWDLNEVIQAEIKEALRKAFS